MNPIECMTFQGKIDILNQELCYFRIIVIFDDLFYLSLQNYMPIQAVPAPKQIWKCGANGGHSCTSGLSHSSRDRENGYGIRERFD